MLTHFIDLIICALIGIIIGMAWHILELRWMRRRMEREGYAGTRRTESPAGGRGWFTCLHRDKSTLRQS